MSDVHDDLATLREFGSYKSAYRDALERVEAEIARREAALRDIILEYKADVREQIRRVRELEAEIARLEQDREDRRPSWRTLELVRDIVERGVGPDTTPDEALKTIGNLIEKRHPREET